MSHKPYTVERVVGNVVGNPLVQTLHRTYLEHAQLRRMFNQLLGHTTGQVYRAADIGCGYGRMTPALKEFANEVWGFEREKEFLEMAADNMRESDFKFVNVETLTHIPVIDNFFNVSFTFTVLQHIPEQEIQSVVAELQRITRNHIVICEETMPNSDPHTKGRNQWQYKELFKPWTLARVFPRIVEPNNPTQNQGTWLAFTKEAK